MSPEITQAVAASYSSTESAKAIAVSQLHDFLSNGFPDIFRWSLHRPPTAEERNGNLCSLFNAMFTHLRNTLPTNEPSPDCFIFTEPGKPSVTFDELCSRISHLAQILAQDGTSKSRSGTKPLGQGDKVLILSSLGVDFFVGSIACLSLGATLILLDPFMERAKMNVCIESVLPITHIVTNMKLTIFKKWILSKAVPALKKIPNIVEIPVNVDKKILAMAPKTIPVTSLPGDTTALLSFTTGSTGNPKPIRRSHDYLRAQTIAVFCQREIKASAAEFPGEAGTNAPTAPHKPVKSVTNLPVFIFGQIMLGYTTLIPDNFNPAGVNPAPLVQAMIRHNVQVAFGSPAFFIRLLEHLEQVGGVDQHGKFLNPLPVRVLCLGGAPVFSSELDIMRRGVKGAAFIFYGASEAEPISKIRVEERILLEASSSNTPTASQNTKTSNRISRLDFSSLETDSGFEGGNMNAICVGHVNLDGGFALTAIAPLDAEKADGKQFLELGHIGEIVVSGPHVHITTTSDDDRIIHELPSETNGEKSRVWLRTGDCGYLDSANRLWLVGRASWVVKEIADEDGLHSLRYWPIAIERSVLETFGSSHGVTYAVFMPSGTTGKPALFVEVPNGLPLAARSLILEHLQETFDVPVDELHVFRKLPRDKRHASKINTMALSKMIKNKKATDKIVIQRNDIAGTLNDNLRRGITVTSLKQSASLPDVAAHNTLTNAVTGDTIHSEQRFKFSNPEQNHFLFAWHPAPLLAQYGGGKAKNMATLTNLVCRIPGVRATVPAWFCVSTEAFKAFLSEHNLDSQIAPHVTTSEGLESFHTSLTQKIMAAPLSSSMAQELAALIEYLSSTSTSSSTAKPYFAVRSSGADEDSVSHSFAGQFDSFLYRQSIDEIIDALKRCWLSAFAPRVMSHRLACGLPINNVRMGVVVQIMVNSECAGVAFSRHPLNPISANASLVEAVEHGYNGNVKETIVPKPKMWVRNGGDPDGTNATGLVSVEVPESKASAAALTHDRARAVGATVTGLESLIGMPVDFEWAYQEEDPMLYCLQVRPIVNLPPSSFFIALDKKTPSSAPSESNMSNSSSDSSISSNEAKNKNDLVDLSSIATRALDALAAPQGMNVTLWDNSNIVESYSGVTTPLTFSFASYNYRIVYETMLTFLGTPTKYIQDNEDAFINLLGYVRGNVYYNLMNWYRLLLLAPLGKFSDPKHMETMMGVKQGQEGNADMEKEFKKILEARPKFTAWHRTRLLLKYISAYNNIDRIVNDFFTNFNAFYNSGRVMDFKTMSLEEIAIYYKRNASTLLRDWKAPVINDLLVMGFFGTLKSFIAKHLVESKAAPATPGAAAPTAEETKAAAADAAAVDSLQNDLLCGEDVESAKPTKMLMEIAKSIDNTIEYPDLGTWFTGHKDAILKAVKPEGGQWILRSTILKLSFVRANELLTELNVIEPGKEQPPVQVVADVLAMILEFLDSYGFRCINELKLEEKDLNDDPAFVIDAIAGYVRTKAYEVEDLDKREHQIRAAAEALVHQKLKGAQLKIFMWLLRNTRRVVKHRENLRFARSKVFGVMRRIFRGMGHQLVKLGALEAEQDVFYLTTEELLSYVDGRGVSRDLKALTKIRKNEFDGYVADANAPPERFITRGAAGVYMWYPHILADLDLLKDAEDSNGPPEPGVLKGVSCCPGVVEGVVRVVKDISETRDLNNEILVTARTDPGWVPLYPMCSGLLIERGSLLSHSAVVARELGLPTIVGISGGLMKRLKTGMRIKMDAGKGRVYILDELEALEKENENAHTK
ncbi:hypothetical protein BGZ80_007769 [Entomortierella chlamydospora]|uniref:Phosphoenolpyruvate synthase n=1 Tax=Entomortierella chlamydospora TaxID=101097 RepID=A0A9P6MZ24_9FUNG|nr:hypothetical protein BGZ80_007769 [Entomortierella chlamydospora]